jgi:hypothetical protein
MTPKEKNDLLQLLRKDAEGDELFTGALGNKNSFFIAKPARRRKPAARKMAKVSV